MKKTINTFIISILLYSSAFSQDVKSLNEKNQSLTYEQTIAAYETLARENNNKAKLFTEGLTDCGRPLHLFVISSDGKFNPEEVKQKGKAVVLINNGIHPGEPDGIDASVRLAQDFLSGKKELPNNVVILIIPIYNIDGSLERGCCSRANQNGPEQYGFRSNAKNLDLNRDFVKADAENTLSFIKIFRKWDPDVFVDTHVSDGADYQYTMTLISTQHNKLGGPIGEYLKEEMTPSLFSMMKEKGNEMTPYVNTSKYDDSPENGIYGFLEMPRFASGYAALYHCLAFVTETHMLKPFASRVNATQEFLECVIDFSARNGNKIRELRAQSKKLTRNQQSFPIQWELDSTEFETVMFKGYQAEYRISKVTGLDQLYYNREIPFTRPIKFYDTYKVSQEVKAPQFYIIPQAWGKVIANLEINQVKFERLTKDSLMEVETYIIDDFKTGKEPFEGHYVHSEVKFRKETKKMQYLKGDYLIRLNQDCNRFIVETLEPQAHDSWFAWGFFDAILQQKEWFSAYVFDGYAEQLLASNPELKKEFENKKLADKDFAANSFGQLYFLYRKSPLFEDYRRYPVGKGMGN